jgi:hypothetical protein
MLPATFLQTAVVPALTLLPEPMRAVEAQALLVAIALQESQLLHRRQFGGPAKSYLQFEIAGIEGVLTHEHTWAHARAACLDLDVIPTAPGIYLAIEFQDTLACVFARLLIWSLPERLPGRTDSKGGWASYVKAWRPGKPRPERWDSNFCDAWATVTTRA